MLRRHRADEVRATPAHNIAIDDVVVKDKRIVQQFHCRRGTNHRPFIDGNVHRARSFKCRSHLDQQHRADELAAEHGLGRNVPQVTEIWPVSSRSVRLLRGIIPQHLADANGDINV